MFESFENEPVSITHDSKLIVQNKVSGNLSVGERVRKIREIKGWNLTEMAKKMNVTTPTYRTIEEDENPRYSILKKFCDATGIDLPFLLSNDVPITEDNIEFLEKMREKCFLLTHEQLRQKVEVYSELLKLNDFYPSRELPE